MKCACVRALFDCAMSGICAGCTVLATNAKHGEKSGVSRA